MSFISTKLEGQKFTMLYGPAEFTRPLATSLDDYGMALAEGQGDRHRSTLYVPLLDSLNPKTPILPNLTSYRILKTTLVALAT